MISIHFPKIYLLLISIVFFKVESLSASVSINFWSLTKQSEVVAKTLAQFETLLKNLQSADRFHGGRVSRVVFCISLIEKLVGDTNLFMDGDDSGEKSSVASFISRLYAARYAHIVFDDDVATKATEFVQSVCQSKELLLDAHQKHNTFGDVMKSSEVRELIKFVLQIPTQTRDLWLGNVVEFVIAITMAPVTVQPMLASCFM
jgi:hypothetical protein